MTAHCTIDRLVQEWRETDEPGFCSIIFRQHAFFSGQILRRDQMTFTNFNNADVHAEFAKLAKEVRPLFLRVSFVQNCTLFARRSRVLPPPSPLYALFARPRSCTFSLKFCLALFCAYTSRLARAQKRPMYFARLVRSALIKTRPLAAAALDEISFSNSSENSKFWSIAFQLWPRADHLRQLMLRERQWSECECLTFSPLEHTIGATPQPVMNDFLLKVAVFPRSVLYFDWLHISLDKSDLDLAFPGLAARLQEYEHTLLDAQCSVIARMLTAHMRTCCVHRGRKLASALDAYVDGRPKKSKKSKVLVPVSAESDLELPPCSCAETWPILLGMPATVADATAVVAVANQAISGTHWRFNASVVAKIFDPASDWHFLSDSIKFDDLPEVRACPFVVRLHAPWSLYHLILWRM